MRILISVISFVLVFGVMSSNVGAADKKKKAPREKQGLKLDANKDSKISMEEWMADPKIMKRFTWLDKDKSGKLEVGELKARQIKMDVQSMDKDKNGIITPEEWKAGNAKRFIEIDGDKDGSLTGEEIKLARKKNSKAKKKERIFTSSDKDKNGKITKAEWNAGREKTFKKLDKNLDKKLDATEMKNYKNIIERIDKDKDGSLSLSEWLEPRVKRFNEMDMNKDGVLVKDEITIPERKKAKGKRGNKREKPGESKKAGKVKK